MLDALVVQLSERQSSEAGEAEGFAPDVSTVTPCLNEIEALETCIHEPLGRRQKFLILRFCQIDFDFVILSRARLRFSSRWVRGQQPCPLSSTLKVSLPFSDAITSDRFVSH